MAREAYIYKLVLDYLETNEGLHSTAEIVSATNTSYASVARVIRKLAKERRVRKRNGPGHSYLYEFVTHEVKSKGSQTVSSGPSVDPVKTEVLYKIVCDWAENGWSPRVIGSIKTTTNVLGRIYSLAIYEAERGDKLNQDEINELRDRLDEALRNAQSLSLFLESLLATPDLWSNSLLSSFCLSPVGPIEDFKEKAFTVREMHNE